ncbi:MAG: hypothetical protein OQL08_03095 [Gammaproteobacteria bacterium]|nr:hypothetical protein [Gammaproteobacteria bacterium]
MGETGREEYASPAPPRPDDTPQTAELPAAAIPAPVDSRQLVLQSRYRQAEARQEPSPQREAYRVDNEPLRIQQALGAYRNASGLADEGGELMPRLDSYV